MKTTAHDTRLEPRESDVQKAAYYLWQELGRPEGRDLQTWLEAKEKLRHQLAVPQEKPRLSAKKRPPRPRDFNR